MALRTERGGGKKGKGRCLTNCLFLCAALDYSCALLTNLTRPAVTPASHCDVITSWLIKDTKQTRSVSKVFCVGSTVTQ